MPSFDSFEEVINFPSCLSLSLLFPAPAPQQQRVRMELKSFSFYFFFFPSLPVSSHNDSWIESGSTVLRCFTFYYSLSCSSILFPHGLNSCSFPSAGLNVLPECLSVCVCVPVTTRGMTRKRDGCNGRRAEKSRKSLPRGSRT